MQTQTDQEIYREQEGLVISYFGSSVAVEAYNGQVFQCHLRRNQELPVVGDHVIWQREGGETGTIARILPRRSLLARGDTRGKAKQPLAANIDVLVIVMAPPPIYSEYLIDRYIVAAELLNIRPIIVLNKVDLLKELEYEAACSRLEPYRAIPYTVIKASAILKDGLDDLRKILHGKFAVLVGPSGVGKSSIISGLVGEAIKVGDVTAKGAGKHTTTATRLYHLPDGGSLIDSPGVREFNLWTIDKKQVLTSFREFQPYLNSCKFRDCAHSVEPGCAVQEAIKNGKISPLRFASYVDLLKEAANSQKY